MKALSINDASVAFNIALEHSKKVGLAPETVRPHILRVMLPISAKNNNYTFDFRTNKQSLTSAIEKQLLDSDVMIAQSVGLGICKVITSLNDAGQIIYHPSYSRVLPYPDARVFDGAVVAPSIVSECDALMAFFNSSFSIQADREVIVEDFDTSSFLYVPETQGSATTSPNIPGVFARNLGKPFKFAGDKTIKFTVVVPDTDLLPAVGQAATRGELGHQNFLVLTLSGFLNKDGAKAVRAYS